jgi:hypothetical protein
MSPSPAIGTTSFSSGWHEGRPMSDYLGDPAVSASQLWKLHTTTPAHLREEMKTPRSTTDAKELGSALHTRIFEPKKFDERYVVLGRCEGEVKKTGERCKYQGSVYRDGQSFCGNHDPYGKDVPMESGLELVTAQQKADTIAMDAALRADREIRELLEADGPREVIGVWQDRETGLWLRIRPDELIQEPASTPARWHWSIVNLKSTGKVARGEPFRRDFENMGNHFKAAFYRMGIRELWPVEPQNFFYPTVETYAPYATIIHRIHEDWLDEQETQVREALRQLADCLEADHWPGYAKGIHDLNMPEWRQRQMRALDHIEFEEVRAA